MQMVREAGTATALRSLRHHLARELGLGVGVLALVAGRDALQFANLIHQMVVGVARLFVRGTQTRVCDGKCSQVGAGGERAAMGAQFLAVAGEGVSGRLVEPVRDRPQSLSGRAMLVLPAAVLRLPELVLGL